MNRPKLLIFASGTHKGGGSGFENMVLSTRGDAPILHADIVGVVSSHERGGVFQRAERLRIPFFYMQSPYSGDMYQKIVKQTGADWVALSGWLKMVSGLNPQKTINIHPGPLLDGGGMFGGPNMYGRYVHEAVHRVLQEGRTTTSAVSMHFVTDVYDGGPVFFEQRVPLHREMTPEDIQHAVNEAEHYWQPRITNMVLCGAISWDGSSPASLSVPNGYTHLPRDILLS